LSWYFFILCFR